MEGSAKIEKTHQILLIEDDPVFARLVQAYLSDVELLSCAITPVSNLADGQAELQQKNNHYAAVLLDLSLPDSQGFSTLETLLYQFPKLNVIVMTGQKDKSLGVEAVQAGAQDFLVKGEFNEDGLAKSLRFSIERSSILNRLEETQQMARIGHWECSPSEHFFSGSEELYRIFSRSFQRKLTCEDIMKPEGPFSIFMKLQNQAQLNKKAQIDTWVQPENGEPRFVSMICTASLLSNGKAFYNGIIQDITERKQAQELKKERDVAEQAAKVREQFIASISHEMRTPMNAILGMSNLLTETPLNTEQCEYVDAIKRSSDLLLSIISDILEMSTIQHNKVVIARKAFSLGELLCGLVSVLKYKAREKGLKFELDIAPEIPDTFIGDALRLNQIMYNLVGNAIKFTEEGEVVLRVRSHQREANRAKLLFEVSDTGVGIPENQQDKIFETFVRVPIADKIYEGTGLGLSIAKNLVEQQGGKLQVESAIGEGSRFFFELWLEYAQVPGDQPADPPAKPSDDLAFHLLIVEDHKMNQIVARRTIQKKWPNVSVWVADNGMEALKVLDQEHIDLVLMDIQMPVLDGFETLKVIRNQKQEPIASLPVLAITAHANIAQQLQFQQSGFNDYVFKPFEPEQLFAAVERQLHQISKKPS
ncbi:MAG: response regulator [Phaeodactylibacter sp.]|uniref:hybrid sensor histidine kinase/response regulator n=1 Tax=Phaeodactylibacter sp. TaxID=1940289 RepID=UPI0032EC8FB4